MMTRTQIYLPEELHRTLLKIAREEKTTLSRLIREGSDAVVSKRYGNNSPQKQALEFFANPPKNMKVDFQGVSAVDLVRRERDSE